MNKFTVVIRAEGFDQYFTRQNEVVSRRSMDVWTDFQEASKVSLRARTQGYQAEVKEL